MIISASAAIVLQNRARFQSSVSATNSSILQQVERLQQHVQEYVTYHWCTSRILATFFFACVLAPRQKEGALSFFVVRLTIYSPLTQLHLDSLI